MDGLQLLGGGLSKAEVEGVVALLREELATADTDPSGAANSDSRFYTQKAANTRFVKGRPNALLLPSEVPTYKAPGESGTETKPGLVESTERGRTNNSKVLVSGTPLGVAIEVPPHTLCSGLGVSVITEEATAANRTHLWVALQDASHSKLAISADYTSSTNTPMSTGTTRVLKFETPYETGNEWTLLYGLICEVMSSANPITIAGTECASASPVKLPPFRAFTGKTGLTTPSTLTTDATAANFVPWMVIV